jgi:hypothetical protein
MGTFTVDGWRTTGQTTIDGGNITTNTITADAIKTSTLNAKTITLGTTGGDSIIKSGNYSAGSAGWQIKANGDAEFNNVTVRGTIAASTIASGSTVEVVGDIESTSYVSGSEGWHLDGAGWVEFENIETSGMCNAVQYYFYSAPNGVAQLQISANGMHLYFIDDSGASHTLV